MRHYALIPLLLGYCACAQVYLGNRVGISIGKQLLNDRAPLRTGLDYGYDLIGGNAAITIELPITDRSSLQAELGYVEKGYRSNKYNGFIGSAPEQLFRLGYADLSVFYKWSALSGNVRPEIFAGPAVAYTLRLRDESVASTYVFEDPISTASFQSGEDRPVDHLAPWEISAVAGAGIILQPGVARIHLNYRYLYGLTSIYRYDVVYADVNGQSIVSGGQFNRTHLITLGFSIPLSREVWDETPSDR